MQSSIWAAGIQLAIAEHVSDKRPRSAALLAGTIHILRRLLDWYLENKRVPEDLFFFSPQRRVLATPPLCRSHDAARQSL